MSVSSNSEMWAGKSCPSLAGLLRGHKLGPGLFTLGGSCHWCQGPPTHTHNVKEKKKWWLMIHLKYPMFLLQLWRTNKPHLNPHRLMVLFYECAQTQKNVHWDMCLVSTCDAAGCVEHVTGVCYINTHIYVAVKCLSISSTAWNRSSFEIMVNKDELLYSYCLSPNKHEHLSKQCSEGDNSAWSSRSPDGWSYLWRHQYHSIAVSQQATGWLQ